MPATIVTFPDGTMTGEGVVVFAQSRSDGAIIVANTTPFHPVDHTWPDQPGDAGTLRSSYAAVDVVEAVMVALNEAGEFAVGSEIPVKRGVAGWTWQVGHRLATAEVPSGITPGTLVALSVNRERRSALSRGHTACHLASLALDEAVADLWRKDPGIDARGNPDFERRASQSSRIHPDGSVDEYRLGKSVRKAGFDTETFAATLGTCEERINSRLAGWVESGARSWIEVEGASIVDRRSWHCALPGGDAVMLCGGTHVRSLSEFASISVALEVPDPQTLVMTTTVVPAD